MARNDAHDLYIAWCQPERRRLGSSSKARPAYLCLPRGDIHTVIITGLCRGKPGPAVDMRGAPSPVG